MAPFRSIWEGGMRPGGRPRIGMCAAGLLLALTLGAAAQEESTVMADAYVTPHFAWAPSLAGGPLKTLAIVPNTGSRDIWDLAQRLPLDHTVFHVNAAAGQFGSPSVFGTGALYDTRRADLNAILDRTRFDLILLANVRWSSLPADIVRKICAQMADGAGVVQTCARVEDPLIKKLLTAQPAGDGFDLFHPFPFEALEEAVAWSEKSRLSPVATLGATWRCAPNLKGRLSGYQVKKGRFVSLAFPGPWGGWASVPALIPGIRVNLKNLPQEEYYYALVAKACLWAAGRNPPAMLQAISPQVEDRPVGEPLTVEATVAPAAGTSRFRGRLAATARDAVTGRYLGRAEADVRLAGSAQTVSLPILEAGSPNRPFLPASDVFLHVQLFQGPHTLDFGAGFAQVGGTNAPLGIVLEKETFEFPEPAAGALEIAGSLEADRVDLELFDSRGRVWEKTSLPAAPGRLAFSLPTERTRILAHGVRAVAYAGGKPAACAHGFFTLRRPRESYYVHVHDEVWPTWHSLRRLERAYEWGMDGLRDHKQNVPQALMASLAGVDLNPGAPHVPASLALDPDRVAALEGLGRTNAALYRPFNQAIYNTTDDCGPTLEVTDESVVRFREWLRAQYGNDIAKLNADWHTQLGNFDRIAQETFTQASLPQGQRAVEPWMAYCRFINETYLEAQARYRAAIKAEDSRAAVGCDALYYGHSLASLTRQVGYMMPYMHPVPVETGRSLAKGEPPIYTGICMGYYGGPNQAQHEFLPWHILLAGNNSVLFWSFMEGGDGDLVLPVETGYRPGWKMAEVGRIKLSGAGLFLNACRRESCGIAILYSEASLRAGDRDSPFNPVEPAAVNFQNLLEDQGLSYNYAATECLVEDRLLAGGKVKLLVLPHAQALSDAEAEAIKQFVRGGGALLADVRPGIRDERGRLRSPGALDEVFGIRRADAPPSTNIVLSFPGAATNIQSRADAAVVCESGKPGLTADGVPLFIENTFGKGRAVLMNVEAGFMGAGATGRPESRGFVRASAPGVAAHPFMAPLFERLGVSARFQARLDGGPPLGVRLIEFRKGDARLLGVEVRRVIGLEYPARLTLDLGADCHAVEIRSGRDFGKTRMLECEANPFDVFLFSLLPRPAGALELSAPDRVRAGDTVRVSVVRPHAPAESVIRFRLVRPDGVSLRDYTRRVVTDGARAEGALPLPYNAAPGAWTLEAADLVTQQSARRTVRVE